MNDVLRSRRADAGAIVALILLVTIFFSDVLFGAGRFFIRDLTRYYYPTKRVIREVILSGEFPYWNPYYSAGQPMAANPEYEIFYPLQLLVLLPSYDLGYRLHILVHFYLAAVGMYLLLRSLRLGPYAGLFGAVSLCLGGVFMSFGNLLPILFAAAWMPWIFLFARRLLLRPNLVDFAAASLFLGMQGLVGEPTTMLQTGCLVGFYALYRGWYAPERRVAATARNLMLVALLVAGGLAVGSAQIIPAVDHVGDSARSRPFTFELVTAWSMPFARPLELLAPNLFGHIYRRGTFYWGGGMYPGVGSPFLFSIYLGVLPAVLLIAAFFVRPRGGRLVLLLSLLAVLLALGRNTPLYHWLYEARIATSIRYPEKFVFLGLLACSILAAMLFERMLGGDQRVLRIVFRVCLVLMVLVAGVAIFAATDFYPPLFQELWGLLKSPNRNFMTGLSRQDWILAAIRFAVATVLVGLGFLVKESVTRRHVWAALMLVFLAIELMPLQYSVLPRAPGRFFTTPPVAATLDPDRSEYRIFHEVDWYGTTETAKKFFGTADAVYWIVRNGLFPMTPAGSGFRTVIERDYDKTQLHPTIDFTDSVWRMKDNGRKDWREVAMAMSNARFRSEYRDFETERKRVGSRMKEAQPLDFLRSPSHPRYYFAEELVTIRNRSEFDRRLRDGKFAPSVAFVHFAQFTPSAGRVIDKTETANTIRLEVESEGPGFLVLSVTPHKYWRGSLDGKPAALHRANIGYQGVMIPPGRHIVEMRYRNRLVPVGLSISILSGLGFLIIVIAGWKSRPQILDVEPEPPPPAPEPSAAPPVEIAPASGQES